jgi:hypothetical protein
MLNYKSKVLDVFNPFSLLLIQLLLLSQELQSMIIIVQNKCFRNQIVPPLLQCLYDRIKFLVICGVLNLRLIQFLTELCDWPVVLAQDCSNCKSTCITLDLKRLAKVWQHQNWFLCDLLLQQIKALLDIL